MLGMDPAAGLDKSASNDDVDFFAGPIEPTGGMGLDAAFDDLSDHGMDAIYGNMTDTTQQDLFDTPGQGPQVSGNIGDSGRVATSNPKAKKPESKGFMEHAFEGTELGTALTGMRAMNHMKAYVDKAKNMFKLELPTFGSCMAFINPGNYAKPKGAVEIVTRMKQNIIVYKPNYILGAVLLFILTIITSPSMLFGFMLIAAVWMFALGGDEKEGEIMKLGPVALNQRTKFFILAPITFLFLMWWCTAAISWTLIVSATATAIHALFHKTPAHMLKRLELSEIPLYEGEIKDLESGKQENSDDFMEFNLD